MQIGRSGLAGPSLAEALTTTSRGVRREFGGPRAGGRLSPHPLREGAVALPTAEDLGHARGVIGFARSRSATDSAMEAISLTSMAVEHGGLPGQSRAARHGWVSQPIERGWASSPRTRSGHRRRSRWASRAKPRRQGSPVFSCQARRSGHRALRSGLRAAGRKPRRARCHEGRSTAARPPPYATSPAAASQVQGCGGEHPLRRLPAAGLIQCCGKRSRAEPSGAARGFTEAPLQGSWAARSSGGSGVVHGLFKARPIPGRPSGNCGWHRTRSVLHSSIRSKAAIRPDSRALSDLTSARLSRLDACRV